MALKKGKKKKGFQNIKIGRFIFAMFEFPLITNENA